MNSRRLKKAVIRLSHLLYSKYLAAYTANKFKHFVLKLTKSKKVAYPSTVMLELTNHCNLACITCPREYDYGKAMEKGKMPFDTAKKVIDELVPYLDSIGLTGMGETFMYNDIEKVVDYIKSRSKGIIISVSTNAMLPDFMERVSKVINKIDTIQISIDGLHDVYEGIRLKAKFETLDANLRQLSQMCKKTSTTLMLNMVVVKENYHQMPDLVRYAEEVGIQYLDFTIFNLAAVTNLDREYYELYDSDDFRNTIQKLNEAILQTKKVIVTNRNFKTDNGFRKCPFPWTHFYICWDGNIVPCCAKPFPKELTFGNVSENRVMEILNNDEFQEWRKMWFENRTPEFCNKCHFIDVNPIKDDEPQQ